jgi:hypothetical protein
MTFTTDDLFAEDTGHDPWGLPQQLLRLDLLNQAKTAPLADVSDIEFAIALTQLLHSDFMAFGTGGGERLTNTQSQLALRALRAVLRRLGVAHDIPWTDFTSFRSYWLAHDGYGSWAARRQMVGETFDPILARLYDLEDAPRATTVAPTALRALADAAAIHDHLRRLAANVDSDPRLAVSVAKDLVESTAKLVLRERGETYTGKEDLPALVSRAQSSLGLHAAGVSASNEEAKALKTILGSLASLTQGVAELRNKVGTGHGRDSVPAWVRPRHARLAAGAASTWCNLMLETLGDPDAPWRSGG